MCTAVLCSVFLWLHYQIVWVLFDSFTQIRVPLSVWPSDSEVNLKEMGKPESFAVCILKGNVLRVVSHSICQNQLNMFPYSASAYLKVKCCKLWNILVIAGLVLCRWRVYMFDDDSGWHNHSNFLTKASIIENKISWYNNSVVITLQLLPSCTKPSIHYCFLTNIKRFGCRYL